MFFEEAICERGKRTEKVLLNIGRESNGQSKRKRQYFYCSKNRGKNGNKNVMGLNQVDFGIHNLKVFLHVFVASECQNSHPQLLENEEHKTEIYNGLTFSHAKQYKTIHNELTMKHLLPEQT